MPLTHLFNILHFILASLSKLNSRFSHLKYSLIHIIRNPFYLLKIHWWQKNNFDLEKFWMKFAITWPIRSNASKQDSIREYSCPHKIKPYFHHRKSDDPFVTSHKSYVNEIQNPLEQFEIWFCYPWVFNMIGLERHLSRVDLMTYSNRDSFKVSTI